MRYVLGNEQLFLNTSSDATAAADDPRRGRGGDLTAPTADELRADIDTFGITSLFDGADLERI